MIRSAAFMSPLESDDTPLDADSSRFPLFEPFDSPVDDVKFDIAEMSSEFILVDDTDDGCLALV